MASSERILEQADALLRRISPAAQELKRRQRRRRQQALARRFRRGLLASIVALVGMAVVGGVLGSFGFAWILLTLVVSFFVLLAFLLSGREETPTSEKLIESELPALPQKTEAWIAQQLPALPPPASRKLDTIATRLEELRPQLQNLDPREPAAVEVRRLVGVELPELVEGYKKVPQHLRKDDGRGRSPQKQLVDGLEVVEDEISRMTRQLASGELDALATQGKYLELKYRGDEDLADG